ncbi:MAG: HAD-IC family P-type ATPase [Candidatus Nealsonbacteria bacterium]
MDQISWHNISWEETVKKLNSDIEKGLSNEEVSEKQKRSGKNVLPKEKPLSGLSIFFEQLKSPLIYILIVAGFVALFLKEWADSIVIFGAVFLNTIVGYIQESKAGKALRALRKIVKIEAQVIREENEHKVDSADLVVGDIIILTAGNKVPADGRIIEANNLKINEASLTGEWLPAQKTVGVLSSRTPLADRDNMVYMGSIVEDGKGKVIVTSVGKNTEIGRVANMVEETKEEKTPLQKKLAHFSKIIGMVVVFISLSIFFGGILREKELLEMFMTSIAIAIAAVPEGLPVAMTVILALGMQRILKRKGLIRKLVAAETMGATSVITTDKTLTLTQGKMEVAETITSASKISAQDNLNWEDVFKQNLNQDQLLLIKIASLSNEAFAENPEEPYPLWLMRGRPTDKALLLAGAKIGFKKPELEKAYHKVEEITFNSQNKFIATLIQAKPLYFKENKKSKKDTKISLIRDPLVHGTQQVLFVSGAPEKIIESSSFFQENGKAKKLKENKILELNKELENLTSRGLRVIALGYKKMQKEKTKPLEKEVKELTFVGFVGLQDPLREEAKEAFKICRKAGMRPVIVTGDHLLTAKSVGKELGLRTKKENIIEGKDLDKISDEDLQKRIKDIDIYARVEPRHKLRIVDAWQKKGEVVAMTGDGINDTPALKKADIGVALGSGTDVAKEVSDLVLLTDNFNIIVAAVEEGRVFIDNIRKVITYLISDSFTETILIGTSIILGWPLPLVAVQILWVNLITDGLPGIALAFEPKEKDVLERKPERKEANLLTREMKAIIFVIGILTDFILLGLLWWLLRENNDVQYIRTMIFACLGIDSLFYIFSCKNLRKNIWQINPFSNIFLVIAVLFGFLAFFAAFYLPVLNILLETVPLTGSDWIIVFLLGIINLILIEAAKYHFIVRHQTEK